MASVETTATELADEAYRRVVFGWAMYDWANSALALLFLE
jgi:MFS-type transporter involved in bile tolerance (Atg22 family)